VSRGGVKCPTFPWRRRPGHAAPPRLAQWSSSWTDVLNGSAQYGDISHADCYTRLQTLAAGRRRSLSEPPSSVFVCVDVAVPSSEICARVGSSHICRIVSTVYRHRTRSNDDSVSSNYTHSLGHQRAGRSLQPRHQQRRSNVCRILLSPKYFYVVHV